MTGADSAWTQGSAWQTVRSHLLELAAESCGPTRTGCALNPRLSSALLRFEKANRVLYRVEMPQHGCET